MKNDFGGCISNTIGETVAHQLQAVNKCRTNWFLLVECQLHGYTATQNDTRWERACKLVESTLTRPLECLFTEEINNSFVKDAERGHPRLGTWGGGGGGGGGVESTHQFL